MNRINSLHYLFDQIVQVIGVAHTYKPSVAMRHYLTRNIKAYHSSQKYEFSYFYKGSKQTLAENNRSLSLKIDPITQETANHWVEPELAVFLGENHNILAFTLANDLTAFSIESRGRTTEVDNTFIGKSWNKSGSLGPRFVPFLDFDDVNKIRIDLCIYRKDKLVHKQGYSISQCLYPIVEIPNMITELYKKKFINTQIPSKKIILDKKNLLPFGTVIMLGTGIIVPQKFYCKQGDIFVIENSKIGKLINYITDDFS